MKHTSQHHTATTTTTTRNTNQEPVKQKNINKGSSPRTPSLQERVRGTVSSSTPAGLAFRWLGGAMRNVTRIEMTRKATILSPGCRQKSKSGLVTASVSSPWSRLRAEAQAVREWLDTWTVAPMASSLCRANRS
ncbi:hypothetical protein E2C01_048855 [Portunus trituberculatus]|uniref:Uncharacterized protein n=1 Tax=Portunus trituberculatus TaxID=210409 RepID=A0A5B7GBM8_PORTR|nr:hypothetical protein [Portunus trituberculatus]